MRGIFAQKPQCAEHVDGDKPNKPAPIGVYEIGYTPSHGMIYDVLNTALHPKTLLLVARAHRSRFFFIIHQPEILGL